MSIATSLTALQQAKVDIANAIVNKGGTVNQGDGMTSFASDINSSPFIVPSGKITLTENATDVNVSQYASADIAVPVPVMPEEYAVGGSLANKTAVGYHVADGVTEILNNTLNYQTALEWIEIPDTVQIIRTQAFAQNRIMALTDLPSALDVIEDYAFFYCLAINTIKFHSKPSSIETRAFLSTGLTDIYVPWSEGEVANAPWGATNATIHYDYTGG